MQSPWQVRRVLALAAAVLVVVAGVGIAIRLLGDDSPKSALTPAPGASTTVSPTPGATNPGVPEPTQYPEPSPSSASASVPDGYYGADLSWVGVDDGFALVSTACGASTCARLLRTTNAGRNWSRVDATGLPRRCMTACPLRVRFASTHVGYVYGAGLVMTTNGGRTWTRQPGPDTHGLEIAHGTAVRVVERTGACPGCAFDIQRSAVGSRSWTRVYQSNEGVTAADLARQGRDVVVTLRRNPAGGANNAQSTLLVSEDGGDTWARHADPCGGSGPDGAGPDEADASQVTWSQDGKLVVLCQRRLYKSNGGNATVTISTDAGRTFSRQTGFGEVTDVFKVAAGRGVLLAEAHYGGDGHVLLWRSTDDGRSWHQVSRARYPSGTPTGFLAFCSSHIVTWAPPGTDQLRRSTDSGRTWRTYRLSGGR